MLKSSSSKTSNMTERQDQLSFRFDCDLPKEDQNYVVPRNVVVFVSKSILSARKDALERVRRSGIFLPLG